MSFFPEADCLQQEELPFPCDEDLFRRKLEKALGKTVSLTFTNNATSMISARTRGGVTDARMHRIFLGADASVIDEIACFIRKGRGQTPLVRAFLRQHRGCLKVPPRREKSLRAAGACHNLLDISRKINAEYFDNRISAGITWGVMTRRRAVRRRTLGSYNGDAGIITINPILDRRTVPRFFVAFIVYHEMLHADMGVRMKNGRRLVHTKEFRRRERLFREYERAISWEKNRVLGR
jgi:hypothetical protein